LPRGRDTRQECHDSWQTKLAGAQSDETVVFTWIIFQSREHRDQVNAKVMADPRIKQICDLANPPFDFKRMAYGGFRVLVDA